MGNLHSRKAQGTKRTPIARRPQAQEGGLQPGITPLVTSTMQRGQTESEESSTVLRSGTDPTARNFTMQQVEGAKVSRTDQGTFSTYTPTQQQAELYKALDRFLDIVIRYQCIHIDIKVSKMRIEQALRDITDQMGLIQELGILSGSYYEGMPASVCGDYDRLITRRSYPTVSHQPTTSETETPTGAGQVMVESNPDQPAYLRLTVPDGMATQTDLISKITKEYNNTRYLSGSMFVSFTLGGGAEVHGPAGVDVAFPENPERGTLDRVHCLCSPTWPACTQEFFLRSRSHAWPSDSLLHDIKQAGCHVVGASHQSTKERDLEWRWSFSHAEKDLIHHLKPEIVRAMYILKGIKKAVWSGDNVKEICSYLFKIACLWVAELSACTDVIFDNVRNVLDWLLSCYQEHYLPHYFICEQNLIGHLSQDTCNEVVSKLNTAKSELWLQVLCCMEMDSNVMDVIESIQGQLGLHKVSKPTREDYTQLLQTLFSCDHEKAVQVLEDATHRVGPDSEEYARVERYQVGVWSEADYIPVHFLLRDHIRTTPASELATLPDKVLLPCIDSLSTILITPSHVDTFRSSLYRQLGDVYHYLYIHYRQQSTDLHPGVLEECHTKAETYYTTGIHKPHPDGWTDRGMSGHVKLAKFHYLDGEWDKVEGVIAKLQPLLEEMGQSPGVINGLSSIIIDKRFPLCNLPWGEDKLLFRQLLEKITDAVVVINPAVLGYYFQGRLALRGDNRPLVEQSISCMQQALKGIWNLYQRKTVPLFIEVLSTWLLMYDVCMYLFHCNLKD